MREQRAIFSRKKIAGAAASIHWHFYQLAIPTRFAIFARDVA
jgi:hypothetical protein